MPTLLTVDYEDGESRYLRSVMLETGEVPPTQEEMEFYYKTLLGFTHYRITLHTREVPEGFALSLIGAVNEIPNSFPAHDIQVAADAYASYFQLLDHVCEMERIRAAVGISGAGAGAGTGTATPTVMSNNPARRAHLAKYRSWVDGILASIRETSAFAAEPLKITAGDDDSFGWILTPALTEAREVYGNRLVVSATVGRKWASKVGTYMFPDIVVARRLSTVNWFMNNARSAKLARTAMKWYVETQTMSPMPDTGVSPWIQQAESQLASVLMPFQTLEPRQAFVWGAAFDGRGARRDSSDSDISSDGGESHGSHGSHRSHRSADAPPPQRPNFNATLTTIIQRIEQDYIQCTLDRDDEPNILRPRREQWERFIRYVLRAFGIINEMIDQHWEYFADVIAMWVRGAQGLDMNRPPLIERWAPMWEVLFWPHTADTFKMRELPPLNLSDRFDTFLQTLDTHDPLLGATMTSTRKQELTDKWVRVFVEREMIPSPSQRVVATVLYDSMRRWILQFVSPTVMDGTVKPMTMGPILSLVGHLCEKGRKGRTILGLRFAVPDKHMPAGVAEQLVDTAPKEAAKPVAGPSVLDIMKVPEPVPSNTLHITRGSEIHLGRF